MLYEILSKKLGRALLSTINVWREQINFIDGKIQKSSTVRYTHNLILQGKSLIRIVRTPKSLNKTFWWGTAP